MAEIEKGKPRPPEHTYRILVLDIRKRHLAEITDACKEPGHEVVPVTTIEAGIDFLNSKDHVPKFDVRRLLREIEAVLPDNLPKKVSDPSAAY